MLTPRRESLFAALQAEANRVCLGKMLLLCLSFSSLSLPLPLYPKGNAIKKVACTIRNNLLASRAEISANKLALNLCVAQTNWSKAKQKPRPTDCGRTDRHVPREKRKRRKKNRIKCCPTAAAPTALSRQHLLSVPRPPAAATAAAATATMTTFAAAHNFSLSLQKLHRL